MRWSSEPFWWLLFAAGGTVAALLVPVSIALTGLAAPLGWGGTAFQHARIAALVGHPLARLYLFVLIALPLFHAAHRIRFGLAEGWQLHRAGRLLAAICYGMASVGAVLALLVVVRL
jgi:succinate dehydrogenase subunit D